MTIVDWNGVLSKATAAELLFRDVLVARLVEPFWSDGTFYAKPRVVIAPTNGPWAQRLLDYVAFSVEWNRRVEQGEAADSSEFDRFRELLGPTKWSVVVDGTRLPIEEGPSFYADEVSWVCHNAVPGASSDTP